MHLRGVSHGAPPGAPIIATTAATVVKPYPVSDTAYTPVVRGAADPDTSDAEGALHEWNVAKTAVIIDATTMTAVVACSKYLARPDK